VFRVQPFRQKSYLFKNSVGGLVLATLVATQPTLAGEKPPIINQAQYEYGTDPNAPVSNKPLVQSSTNSTVGNYTSDTLVDPLGTITGCNGKLLDNYEGYQALLFNTVDRLNPTTLVNLDKTELPDIPDNGIGAGIQPNNTNLPQYRLINRTDEFRGRYNFLFNESQVNTGASYILIIRPPENSTYGERRILIHIDDFNPTTKVLKFTATSLDGKQIGTTESSVRSGSITIDDAARVGIVGVGVCEDRPAKIIKTADRATAEPGDTVVYRITLSNQSDAPTDNPIVKDTFPLGMSLRTNTIRAQLGTTPLPVAINQQGNVASFQFCTPGAVPVASPGGTTCPAGFAIPPRQIVNLVYGVTLDADALRGTGQNSALLQDNTGKTLDGPATHLLTIRPGLIRDTGTIIGRVFVDKNFDGQQQPNEPGIPNAVIFMDDGNRVTTDVNGLFSIQSAVAGYRTGALDLGSLPGYSLAPNLRFNERNSRSRLVKLAPGGIVRMNFGVTPTAREVK
jgi:uncharacterized repeat protein (TIGR01451 family)